MLRHTPSLLLPACLPVCLPCHSQVITAHPPVLSYSVQERLVPFWEYLTSIGVPNVAAAVARRPSILGLSVDTSLRKIVEYLQYIETPPDKIVEYICNTI